MAVVNVDNMLNALESDFLLMNTANGYSNSVDSAEQGYRQLSENNETAIKVFIFPGSEKVIDEGNNNVPATSEIEIFVSIQAVSSGQKESIIQCNSLKADLKRFVYQLEATTDKWIFSSLAVMDAAGVIWKGWSLSEIESGFEWKDTHKCEIFASLKILYNTTAGALAVGDTPVLTSPSDTATGQAAATIFNWTGTGLSYEIQIATDSGFTNTVLTQSGLTSSSFTIPADFTLNNSTVYYWRVRSTNVLSAWSTTRSFTTESSAGIADYTTNLLADWDADSGVTQSGGLVSAWLDSVGGYNLLQATGGLKPTLVANALNSTKSIILFSGGTTGPYMDLAAAINLVNFTVIVVFKSDNATPASREYIFGGSVQGLLGMATVAQGNHTYGVFSGGIRSVAYSAGDVSAWHIRSFQNTKLYSNGVEGTYNSTGTTSTLSLSRLGCRADNTTQTFTGKIARIRIYSGVLSTTNRAIAETYLNSLYAIY